LRGDGIATTDYPRGCPVGAPELEQALSQPVPKVFRDGTHRPAAPADTIARVHAYAREMGITRLGNITGLDRIGIPVAIAVRPKSRSISVFLGKGFGLEQAYASALMEAAEFFHGESIQDRFLLASYRELARKAAVVEVARLCCNGRRFDPRRAMEWIKGYDLLRDEPCWVPAEIVHTDMARRQVHDSGCFLRSSNGLASGNNLADALSSAICEVVERDSIAVWAARDFRDRAGCHLDPPSIADAPALNLLAQYERAGIGVRVWDVTSDAGIATFVCHIREDSNDPSLGMRRFHGAGCHPDRGIALTRALTEAAQTRLSYISGARDDLPPEHYAAPDNGDVDEALLDALQAGRGPRSFGNVPHFGSDDIADDVRWELERLRSIGIERAIAVDLTRPELGISVVRVVIPGLEGDNRNPEYVAGRRARAVEPRARRQWRGFRLPRTSPKAPHGNVTCPCITLADGPSIPAAPERAEPFAVIFAGPTLPPPARPSDPRLLWQPPARQGDVYRAALQGPSAIGLIDGYFDAVPSVWHKEILWAMDQGIRVYGAASMGALRAAELAEFGMLGVGRIFQMYSDGTLTDDDEVAVLHAPEDLHFIPLTEAMVNVRATVSRALEQGLLQPSDAEALIVAMKSLPYQERTRLRILAAVQISALDQQDWWSTQWVDQKRIDALAMVVAANRHVWLADDRDEGALRKMEAARSKAETVGGYPSRT
jgi:YcaO-like protein with predicted kinase domain